MRRRPKRRRGQLSSDSEEAKRTFTAPRTHLALWTLRLLLNQECYQRLCDRSNWPMSDVIEALLIPYDLAREAEGPELRELLVGQLRKLERNEPVRDTTLFRNIKQLGDLLGLSPVDELVLAFVVTLEVEQALRDCLGVHGTLGQRHMSDLVAGAIGVTPIKVRRALRPGAVLLETRLMEVKNDGYQNSGQPLTIMDDLDVLLMREHASVESLLSYFFRPSPKTELTTADFSHVTADLELITRYLGAAMRKRARGVNVLVHGPPGTGKTELVRVVAAALDTPLFEVSYEGDDGKALDSEKRFGAYRLCQRVLAKGPRSMVLFDEIEDVFPRQYQKLFGLMTSGSDKGWTNRLLESNTTPTLWVGNDIDQVDAAFLRRFDLIVELLSPPPKVRRRILETHCGGLKLGDDWLVKMSGDERLHPGHIEQAARVAKTIAPRSTDETEQLLARVIDGKLRANGQAAPARRAHSDACAYDLSFVNATCDLEKVSDGLARSHAGTLCLYGPPGTGKSAFVAHLADRLGLPLHSRRGSDLMSCWVGGTEANLARMFREATAQQALLFLDEADSYLQDRRRAAHSWEITGVNELLVQMEAFEGIFVCATNLVDSLDLAVFRRFVLKARFDPLESDQRWRMLEATLTKLGIKRPRNSAVAPLRRELDRLDGITPGDFAAVARRVSLLGDTTGPAEFIAALGEECSFKDSAPRRAGFLAAGPQSKKVGT